jgi:hypothetical protein
MNNKKCKDCKWYSPLMWLDDDKTVGECTIEVTPVETDRKTRYDGFPVRYPDSKICHRFESENRG